MPKARKNEKKTAVVLLVELEPEQLRAVNEEAIASGKSVGGVVRKTTKMMLKRLRNNKTPILAIAALVLALTPVAAQFHDYFQ